MKTKSILSLFILILILGTVKNIMSQEKNPPINYYYLKVETNDAIATVYLNGAPIVKSFETDGLITMEPINQWLIENENTLSYEIHGSDETNKGYNPTIKAFVFLHDSENETPTPKKIIASIESQNDKDTQYPNQKSVNFEFTDTVTTMLWKEASPIKSITDSDKKDILEIANSFIYSIINEKYDKAIEIQEYKIKEDALAEGKTYSRLKDVTRKTYDWVGTQGKLTSNPVNPNELKYVLCCDNKLVHIVRSNNEEAIIIESEELYLDIATFYAKINGKWTIVR